MAALDAVGGYTVLDAYGRRDALAGAATGVDVLVIATPDAEVAQVAASVVPVAGTVVLHLSGSLGLDALGPHARRASLHPLVPLPNPEVGAARLRSGVTFAVAGDPVARDLADALGGEAVVVADADRPNYHAAATIAANHLVALLGQVERVAATAGLPLGAFAGLIHAAADDALALGPHDALTGPAIRGDWTTIDRHRAVLGGMAGARNELVAYDAMVVLARRLSLEAADLDLDGAVDGEGWAGEGAGPAGAAGTSAAAAASAVASAVASASDHVLVGEPVLVRGSGSAEGVEQVA
jgi:predicted short-subunit dehydrogenase-like oxidoreductase (DUF2520 family)